MFHSPIRVNEITVNGITLLHSAQHYHIQESDRGRIIGIKFYSYETCLRSVSNWMTVGGRFYHPHQ